MERISIFNYEAFYLDFLEGNLNEEDTALLMAFLEANPDLKMEDDSLPTFEAEEFELDDALKNDLKQPLIDEAITNNNVEYFMISDAEGIWMKRNQRSWKHLWRVMLNLSVRKHCTGLFILNQTCLLDMQRKKD